jgi:hypothetical protein
LGIIVIKKRGKKISFCIDSILIVFQSRVHDQKGNGRKIPTKMMENDLNVK